MVDVHHFARFLESICLPHKLPDVISQKAWFLEGCEVASARHEGVAE